MTAQYKPYKDQEDFDEDQINEEDGGRVQIFDRSTKPPSRRRLVIGGIVIAVISIIFGVVIGYFGHTSHSNCKPVWSVSLQSVKGADRSIRAKILQQVNPDNIRKTIRHATKTSRIAGLEESKKFTKYIEDNWKRYGLETTVHSYNVLLNYAQTGSSNQVQIISEDNGIKNVEFDAKSTRVPGNDKKLVEEMDPIAAYSKSGTVVGYPVYGGFCLDPSRDLKAMHSINLTGNILICRQIVNRVEEVVRKAEIAGAAGVIFYIDPEDLGAVKDKDIVPGDSVAMMNARYTTDNLYGDPLTPGYPAKNSSYGLRRKDAHLPNILVQPISTDDAYTILKMMGGDKALSSWNGGFNFTYSLGPGFQKEEFVLKMVVNNVFEKRRIENVIGTLKGEVEPDRYVIIGAHRDAWRYGAINNAGGTAVLDELANVFGNLVKSGWKPRRTIIFASWDANCFGRIGSNEWVEEYLKILKNRAVAYLSVDSIVTGTHSIVGAGSPLLMNAVFNATKEVKNPNRHSQEFHTLYDQWLNFINGSRDPDTLVFKLTEDMFSKHLQGGEKPRAGTLRALFEAATTPVIPEYPMINKVSDWQAFFEKVGIPVASFTFKGGAYNHAAIKYDTKYDTFERLELIDPDFKLHAAVAQSYGELLRNIADSLFLPFNLFDYVQYIFDRSAYHTINKENVWKKRGIDISTLKKALESFIYSALYFHIQQETIILNDPTSIRRVNDKLHLLEQTFTEANLLPSYLLHKSQALANRSDSKSSFIHDSAFIDMSSRSISGILTTLSSAPYDIDSDIFKIDYSIIVSAIESASMFLGSDIIKTKD